jgi:predicted alpha/beta superfamily hydrolase
MKFFKYSILFFLLSFSLLAHGQKNEKPASKKKPFVLGIIDEIQSSELSEKRILNIYLPEGYEKNDSTKYPVVYLLDGSADEDFIHIVGLYQFYSFPWIQIVQPSIIVGIANVDRRRDFTYPTTIAKAKAAYPTTGQSAKFIAFLERELQPYIEKHYKADSSKTLIGESLGGLLAAEILLTKPSLFNKYIIVSPSLWWDNGSLLKRSSDILLPSYGHKTEVYIGVGKEGLVPGDNPHVMEVDANILADKIMSSKSKTVKVYFDYLPQENHATIMHQAVMNALRFLNPEPVENK